MKTDPSIQAMIFGCNAQPGLVAAEHVPGADQDRVRLFFREGGGVRSEDEPFRPFLWIEAPELLAGCPAPFETQSLEGEGVLRALAVFPTWKALDHALGWLRKKTGQTPSAPAAPFFLINDEIQQHLMRTGRTFFKGMRFRDLRRLTLDIETWSGSGYEFSNAERASDRILAIGLADSTGWSLTLSGAELDEKTLLERFVAAVAERDPDVLEGHNLFAFALDYLAERARRHRVPLAIGREGRVPQVRAGRFSAGERVLSYPRMDVFGRSVVDTYFLVQIYDQSHRSLPGFGLKETARHFGLAAPGRTYVEGREIAGTFERDPARVLAYLRDDVREAAGLGALLAPVYFAQAQLLPLSFQNLCLRGNAVKIDALLLREYLRDGGAIPRPDAARPFEGGYTDIFFTGVARPVHHCDVRSLYPSLMLAEHLGPKSDRRGVFLNLLHYLRGFRLAAKDRMKRAAGADERAFEDALQSTFKILINSFYGYLGFEMARFNDYDAAERVTARGRDVLRAMIEAIRAGDGVPIEIDTDGVYFVPPEGQDAAGLERFRARVAGALPKGIEVEFDGEYEAMFSYKMKNYALLDAGGEIVLRGAALKSRGLEPFQRAFIEEVVALKLRGREAEIPALSARYRDAIRNREWPIRELAKTERLQDSPATYAERVKASGRGRNAAYELALGSGREYRAGDTLSYYVTGDRKNVPIHANAKLVAEWDPARRDENVAFYLAKLDELAEKFSAGAGGEDPRQGELGL